MVEDRNSVIKKACEEVFSLDPLNSHILGEFAEKGEINRNKINLAKLSDRQISRRTDKLHEDNFLKVISKTPYRNTNKEVIVFGLTFKGLIASLRNVNVENNYIVKNYLDGIENEKIRKLELNYIINFLVYFFEHNRIRGIILDKMKNIGAWFYDFETETGISETDLHTLEQLKKQMKSSFNKVEEGLKKLFHDEKELQKQWIVMNRWHKSIEIFIEEKSFDKVVSKMIDTATDVITKKKDLDVIDIDDNETESEVYKGIRIVTRVEKYEKR